jgi:hypothetical protein
MPPSGGLCEQGQPLREQGLGFREPARQRQVRPTRSQGLRGQRQVCSKQSSRFRGQRQVCPTRSWLSQSAWREALALAQAWAPGQSARSARMLCTAWRAHAYCGHACRAHAYRRMLRTHSAGMLLVGGPPAKHTHLVRVLRVPPSLPISTQTPTGVP